MAILATASPDFKPAVETQLEGYIALYEETTFGGISFGMFSRRKPEMIKERRPNATVVNIKRARQIAREFHDWDLPTDEDIAFELMAGNR